jgi:tetratricopeptide (TPR) repeat protein
MRFERVFFLILLLAISPLLSLAQTNTDEQLAAQYFKSGEFDKAEVLYEKLYKRTNDEFFYRYYIDCLLKLKNFTEAEKVVEKRLKKEGDPVLLVQLGHVYQTAGDEKKAQQTYAEAVKQLPPVQRQIERMAEAFLEKKEATLAVLVYEKGRKLLNGIIGFRFELAQIHASRNKIDLLFNELLAALDEDPNQVNQVRTMLLDVLADDPEDRKSEFLKDNLIERIQKSPDKLVYPELLIWHFEQKKDFRAALTQTKALDRRNKEDGSRVYQLGIICKSNRAYDAAIESFEYVIKKGRDNYYYLPAKKELVSTLYLKVTDGQDYNATSLASLEQTFLSTIDEFGRSARTASMMMDLAELYTFYIHDTQKGIDLLLEVAEIPGIRLEELAQSKVQLADALLFIGDVWEATLLYSQAEKLIKTGDIGRMAKLKNAKLAYYTGEFEWAQAQLNVLKAATSDLISNDALYLAMLISDNSFMDTTYEALSIFARADLFIYQNKIDSAIIALDSIEQFHAGHSLQDDILLKKAEIAEKRRDYKTAVELYHRIWKEHGFDILGDDAVYRMAKLHEERLSEPDKAMEYYQILLLDYPGSLFTVEARKRFRTLRGDLLN